MIQNQLKLIPLSDIKVTRASRQRSTITSASVYELALSIAHNGLLQNIGVLHNSYEIIFGERRFTAFTLLANAAKGYEMPSLSSEQNNQLILATKENPLYEKWTKIPSRLIKAPDNLARQALEFIENASREDLPWQDKANAAYSMHKEALAACKTYNNSRTEGAPLKLWTESATASLLGISLSYLSVLIYSHRELESATNSAPQIKDAITHSASPFAAKNAVNAIKERHKEPLIGKRNRLEGKKLKPAASAPNPEPEPEPEPELHTSPIINTDFHEWAASYSGPPFNFLHCDFPYGISYNKRGGFNTGQANKQQGVYDDSESVYWNLLSTLAKHQHTLIAPQAHILFWFSQNMRTPTETFITTAFPTAVVQKHLMIWVHPTLQTTPDPHRYGQRNYETALLLTFGDRKILKPKRLATVYDEQQQKIHRSQKPLPVLSHFFEMFVDSSTIFLDPTCGSATSLIAAKRAGATRVRGLELDPEMCAQAREHYANQTQK